MAKVSMSEAARLAGVSRQTLYRKADAGELSVERDGDSVSVDTSELLRVFGELQNPDSSDSRKASNGGAVTGSNTPAGQPVTPPIDGAKLAALEVEARMLRDQLRSVEQQLAEARERESWLQGHAKELTVGLRLLEDKSQEVADVRADDRATIAELRKLNKKYEAENGKMAQALKTLRHELAEARKPGSFFGLFKGGK